MHRLIIALTLTFFVVTGCGLGASKYNDAVLDGISHLNTGKPDRALEDFNRAIKIDPQRADGYLGRANTLNTMGRYEDALKDYERVLEIDSKLANAYINRGSAYSHLGEYEKAIADYEKGLELDPKIDNKPSFFKRLFSNEPNTDKGIRKHLEYLKQQVKEQSG
ncbi:MAG: tetratricopeptide repeat protein [Desulfobacteraceae bacterium]|jgi:tetratricopeptide (TPR) repeat protein|nr:tetratricopeptide repeat protein [Desulfobacteraceae bacterium]